MTEAASVLILQVSREENRRCQGRTLADIAAERGTDPIETAMDLIASDRSRVGTASDAIRKMSGLPAQTLQLKDRGLLREGYFADVVVFDPAAVADLATFARPHQLSAGVSEVIVNGTVTLSGGEFTGRLAGRALAGPGARR